MSGLRFTPGLELSLGGTLDHQITCLARILLGQIRGGIFKTKLKTVTFRNTVHVKSNAIERKTTAIIIMIPIQINYCVLRTRLGDLRTLTQCLQ